MENRARNRRRGFTLFELVITVGVIAIVAAIAVPTMSTMFGDAPLTAAADKVKSRWAEARSRAIAENRPYRFAVIDGTSKFKIAPDSPEFWDATGAGPDGMSLVVEDTLPADVRFTTPEGVEDESVTLIGHSESGTPGDWSAPIVFLPDGTAREDALIAFSEANSSPILLRLRGVTGTISTSR